jgi:hypothetical protein
VRGTNLLDLKALNNASFISQRAPLGGRNLFLVYRALF